MQGLHMMSRDGKHFYWVIVKLPTGQEKCVIAYLFDEWAFTSFPQARNFLQICEFLSILYGFYQFCMTARPIAKSFQSTQWKVLLTWCFSSVRQAHLLSLQSDCAVAWQNKYLVNPGFGLWNLQNPGRRGILEKFLLCWIILDVAV